MSFGFTLRGHAPVWIDSVIPGEIKRRVRYYYNHVNKVGSIEIQFFNI